MKYVLKYGEEAVYRTDIEIEANSSKEAEGILEKMLQEDDDFGNNHIMFDKCDVTEGEFFFVEEE